MRRVLALLAAVALVGGAFVVRSKVIDDGGGTSEKGRTKDASSVSTIACAPELTSVCDALASNDIKVFPDSVDLANAASTERKIDVWLTYGPAPDMVNAATADQQQKVFDTGTIVAAGRIAVVAPSDRSSALARYCRSTTVTWKCLTRAAGSSWTAIAPNTALQGTVKVGVADPTSALGAILVGPSALSSAAGSDPGIDEIDVDAVSRLVSSVDQKPAADELSDLTVQGPAAYSAVVAPGWAASRAAATARGQSLGLTVLYPEPVAMTVLVLSPPNGGAVPRSVLDALAQPGPRRALRDAGWSPAAQGTTAGLPAPDVLFALGKELSR